MQEAKHMAWLKRMAIAAASSACGLLLASCGVDLGKCDATQITPEMAAGTVHAGQMVINAHCASGRCHSALATGKQRYGVPAGLNFDTIVNGTTVGSTTLAIATAGAKKIKDEADGIWDQVSAGDMPPKGQGTVSADEKQQLRNWLACGADVVTTQQGGGPVTADWTSIYTTLTTATCFACHASSSSAAGMGFSLGDMGDQCAAYAAVVNKQSVTPMCMGKNLTLVVPGHPETSFMLQKLKNAKPPCGDNMPLMTPPMPLETTNPAVVMALEQWITAGATKPATCP